jgi:hypothetical protein
MKRFFLFSLAYLAFGLALLVLFRDAPDLQVLDGLRRATKAVLSLMPYLPYLFGGLVLAMLAGARYINSTTLKEMGWAFAGSLIFMAAFVFVKTSIPYIVPFYADSFFADLDKALHGGVDPWEATHRIAPFLDAQIVSVFYLKVWGLPAAFFLLILAACDPDPVRRNRFTLLYVFVWIGLGNVAALAGSSVGPIYYDRLLGTGRFTDLIAAIDASGVTGTRLGEIQQALWVLYARYDQAVGAGISAFPSVHNGVATLVMIYLWERSRWLAPVGVAFCAAILFCSVYVGWHYALDGYASIILVTGAWWLLRGRAARLNRKAIDSAPLPA